MSRSSPTTLRTSVAERIDGRGDVLALPRLLRDAVELEGEVGEGLTGAVVEVLGDAAALLVGAQRAEPTEPAGVVDGEGGRVDEAAQQLDVALGEVGGGLVLERDDADGGAAGGEHAVEAGPAAGVESGPGRGSEVVLAVGAAHGDGAGHGWGELGAAEDQVGPDPVAPGHVPGAVGLLEEEDGDAGDVEQVAQLLHRGIEDLGEVEGRRQRLGDLVELEEQHVGVGEAPQAVRAASRRSSASPEIRRA